MKLTEYYKLLKENEEKLEVIDTITDFHPGMGTEMGWSWYVGGMRDTGEWKTEVLLKIPLYTLKRQLDIWVEEKNTPREPHDGAKEAAAQKEWVRKYERALIWGSGKI